MTYHGYAGKVLYVDLTTGSVTSKPLDLEMARKFIGGFGLNHKLAYDAAEPGADPLSPGNPIVLGAGPLVGTPVPGAVKIFATTKLPLTKTFGSPAGSMSFGSMLKWAGYDHVVITGRADRPIYINIVNDEVTICDAAHLWGKDVLDATEELKGAHQGAGIICIGPAGENLVSWSLALVDGIASLGRGGLGAVMGSKNLKAICVYGSQGIRIADPARFTKAVNTLVQRMITFRGRKAAVDLGMMAGWDMLATQYFCTKYLTPEQVQKLYGPEVYKGVKLKRVACPSCLLGDKDVLAIKDGRYAGLVMPETSFINIPALGTRFAITDFSEAAYLFNLLDRYGLCGQTLEGLFDFVISLYEKGRIGKEDTGGLELKRNFDTVKTLICLTTRREGFGEVLAGGWRALIAAIGKGIEKEAAITKGINFLWDPRLYALGTMEFEQLVSPRGPYSAFGGSPTTVPDLPVDTIKRHCDRVGASREQIERIFDSPDGFDVGRLTRCFEDWVTLLSCMGICNRAAVDRYYAANLCAELYSAATGIEMSREEAVLAAERSWNVTRLSNVREGFDRSDDEVIPDKWFEPLKTCDGKEHVIKDYYHKKTPTREDIVRLLDSYYRERGWSVEDGAPTKEKLRELGLAGSPEPRVGKNMAGRRCR